MPVIEARLDGDKAFSAVKPSGFEKFLSIIRYNHVIITVTYNIWGHEDYVTLEMNFACEYGEYYFSTRYLMVSSLKRARFVSLKASIVVYSLKRKD